MLSDTKARQAKAKDRPYKLTDGRGLYLYVSAKGAKSWRYDYRLGKRRETLTLGRYPDVALAGPDGARERLEAARKQVEKGESPTLAKKREKQAAALGASNTVQAMGDAWYEEVSPTKSNSWKYATRRWLTVFIYPAIGSQPINEVGPPDILAIIKPVAKKGHARSAEYIRHTAVRLFEFAIRNLRAKHNPARELKGAITIPTPKSRRPLTAKEIPQFVQDLDRYPGRIQTKLAIELLMLLFVRKSELAEAKIDEFDFEAAEWRIPGERLKMKRPHLVPLPHQAIPMLKQLMELNGNSEFLLPKLGDPRKPMGHTTFNKAFDIMGWGGKFTPHGLRATASTILNEQGWNRDAIERQLAHVERNKTRAAYNQAEYLTERQKMVQSWADYIEGLSSGANVVNIGKAGKGARKT